MVFYFYLFNDISAWRGIYFSDNYSDFNKAVFLFFSWATFGFIFYRLCEDF
ncbi:uncharacterized protein EbC_17930 [Erwinia billingiae Eb661]|uniref:Uncharacterized protein n=1 Tax=Erwinia billingiae (strain Eb661) TaxID=634500 RepID=D8MR67_ERWBE|nr:uncharacterized protein EbC_17930 [Erwinia billingiae Eb661]